MSARWQRLNYNDSNYNDLLQFMELNRSRAQNVMHRSAAEWLATFALRASFA